LMASVITA